nr:hypothetical protein [Cystoclonium purpureum f. stellatum]
MRQILLVDDDIFLINSISLYLVSKNFSVCVVDSVSSALCELKKKIPDLIIADIMMPDLDGYNLLEILRSDNLFYPIPVIFLTAKGLTSDRIKGYDAGCNAYLTKPFDPNELVSIINNLLKNKYMSEEMLKQKDMDRLEYSHLFIKSLTIREIAVLELVIRGHRNKEIALRLSISIRSVEKYVSKLLHKTSTRNRTELAQFINSKGIKLYKGE